MSGRINSSTRADRARATSVDLREASTIEELPPPRSWVIAPGQVRKITMGSFRRRTPLTELLHEPRWLGDVSPWSTAKPSRRDIPRWVQPGFKAGRIRPVVVSACACAAIFFASASQFVTRG